MGPHAAQRPIDMDKKVTVIHSVQSIHPRFKMKATKDVHWFGSNRYRFFPFDRAERNQTDWMGRDGRTDAEYCLDDDAIKTNIISQNSLFSASCHHDDDSFPSPNHGGRQGARKICFFKTMNGIFRGDFSYLNNITLIKDRLSFGLESFDVLQDVSNHKIWGIDDPKGSQIYKVIL